MTNTVTRQHCCLVASQRSDSLAQWRRTFGALPSPLWGGVGGGGDCVRQRWCITAPPPPHPSPTRGEGADRVRARVDARERALAEIELRRIASGRQEDAHGGRTQDQGERQNPAG